APIPISSSWSPSSRPSERNVAGTRPGGGGAGSGGRLGPATALRESAADLRSLLLGTRSAPSLGVGSGDGADGGGGDGEGRPGGGGGSGGRPGGAGSLGRMAITLSSSLTNTP